MRILFLAPRLPHHRSISGTHIVFQRMRRLIDAGHEVGLACFMNDADEYNRSKVPEDLLELHCMHEPSKQYFKPQYLKYGPASEATSFSRYYYPPMLKTVGEMVQRSRYDVVIAEYSAMGQYLSRNPYLPAVRKVVSVHESATLNCRKIMELLPHSAQKLKNAWRLRQIRDIEMGIYRAADRVLTLTPEEKQGILSEQPDLDITVVPSGVDVGLFHPDETIPKEDALVFTGRYTNEQNQDAVRWFVQEVWPKLKRARPELTFYMVGRVPTPEMISMAAKDERLILAQDVKDVRPYLNRAKIFVCPIRTGSGLRGKVLEAMASGLPVVTTTVGSEGIPFHIGKSGFIADTPSVMQRYVELLLDDAPLRKYIGQSARRVAEQRYSWQQSVNLLDEVLAEVVAHRHYDYSHVA